MPISVPWGVLAVLLVLLLGTSRAAWACTAAGIVPGRDVNPAGMLQMTPAAGLLMSQTTVRSAYHPPASMDKQVNSAMNTSLSAQARPASLPASLDLSSAQTDFTPTQPKAEAPEEPSHKPLAMVAAALVLMVSIALRRSGKS